MTRRSVRILATIALGLIWLATAVPAHAANKYAALILDADTGTVLFERHAKAQRHPASLTKIMTLYMLFDALKDGRVGLEDRLKVSTHAAAQPPSNLHLRAGDTIRVEDAILALVTKSANDVAVVVAEALGGTEYKFARQMTQRARQLGMRSTTFRNASGLHDGRQVTTAYDMAMLALAVRRDFPQEYGYFATRRFDWKGRAYNNHNKLLGHYRGTDGIKTGYIGASGFNLVASVERNGRRLIGVVFGGKTGSRRDRHMKRLLDSGFKKAADIRVAEIVVPPLPSPRPDREVRVADADTSARVSAEAASLLPPLPVPAPEFESGSRDEGVEWGIQVGAYATELRAQRSIALARGHLVELLTGADALVEPLDRRTGTIYRARLLGLSEQEARSACLSLKRRQLPCVPVPARADIELAAGPKG
ncbi:peptidase M15 [Thalassobaculum fulvum]|uniref:Peptidase M15 n=1 Tax=Thalassobaculum fulvum TaxID=1633335 RepID=A0A918XRQ3_9PROT|nr:D-alanyl-D-alanine carboxypeptidase family protein [Thalassobaculum fulvum]GHD50498.1 peptidase M15 [Thalassobaculum fulvum]